MAWTSRRRSRSSARIRSWPSRCAGSTSPTGSTRSSLVAPPGWEEPAILLAEELGCDKVSACVAGGETRADSVRAGLAEVPEDALVVLVHDAARPLLPAEVIERVLAPLSEGWDGAVPGPAGGGHAEARRAPTAPSPRPSSRDGLWAVQTPQAFLADVASARAARGRRRRDRLRRASSRRAAAASRSSRAITRLLKVTTADDLAKIASWLYCVEFDVVEVVNEDVLRPYVDLVASSERWGVEKPSPEFFARVVAEADRPADEIAYVGDRVDNDVLPARERACSPCTCAAAHGATPRSGGGRLRVHSLDELLEVVA